MDGNAIFGNLRLRVERAESRKGESCNGARVARLVSKVLGVSRKGLLSLEQREGLLVRLAALEAI